MTVLNKALVEELFRREAVLIDRKDVAPFSSAAALFGEAAAKFARRQNAECWGGYGVGDYTFDYLTYWGFLAAASYYNVQQLRDDLIEVQDYRILPIFAEKKRLKAE